MSTQRRYLPSHEWALPDAENKRVTVGLSQHAIEELGDIVYLELPQTGKQIKKGDVFGVIESVKAASDIYAPVSGEIVEVNSALPEDLNLFKTDPYGQAWLVKIRPADPAELDTLLDEAAYQNHLQAQSE